MSAAVGQVKNSHLVERIAAAVLYEGYILYPYRPSSVKNQQRWNFGALCPDSYAIAQKGTENSTMQTQCLIEADSSANLRVKIRFLHLLTRQVGEVVSDCQRPVLDCGHVTGVGTAHFRLVPSLEVGGSILQTWQEAIEREVVSEFDLRENKLEPVSFSFPSSTSVEAVPGDEFDKPVGLILRTQQAVEGLIEIGTENLDAQTADGKRPGLQPMRITIRIHNRTAFPNAELRTRDEALMCSCVSTHTILEVENGAFVSLLDPPGSYKDAAAGCTNIGTYPVLVGEDGDHDCLLSSPIILYDYPQIAPESAGDLYDGTEIDEILTLRIMTLTEEEKREMRSADVRARQLLERTEAMPAEQLMRLHGVMKKSGTDF